MTEPEDRTDATDSPSESTTVLRCCCGSLECVFLRHSYSVLNNVERDVHQAAQMGQALLARHEAYMADAERDRNELTSRIEQLEIDNKELEAKNARTIQENRNLLDQLEALNTTVNDTDGRIKSLEATLLSSQQTIRRLEGETARAAALERQLSTLEQEQAELQNHLSLSREDARSALSRWQRAERGINDLQEQLERIEKESREEREHHMEMIGRIEKQREMEKELNTAAGRLKGAAAAKSLNPGNGGSSVVGHFVRDLLQDNAHLQHGIAELREMLMNSNDEIQALREQLMYHQPLGDGEVSNAPTLRAELEPKAPSSSPGVPGDESPKVSQELHIHHHYHVASTKQEAKRPRKKRLGLTPGIFVPPAGSLPTTPPHGFAQHHRSASHASRGPGPSNRWSAYSEQPSEFAPSSVPSSPRSNNRNSSLFDPSSVGSFPGSPTTSVDPMSPTWRATHRKQPSNMSARSFQTPTYLSLNSPSAQTHHNNHHHHHHRHNAIIEESDDTEFSTDLTSITDDEDGGPSSSSSHTRDPDPMHEDISITLEDVDSRDAEMTTQPVRIRRVTSHESILSLSGGLDIHTLKSRPSQLTLRHLTSATSVTGSSAVTARPMLSRDSAKRSSVLLRDSYGSSPSPLQSHSHSPLAMGTLRAVSNPGGNSTSPSSSSSKLGRWTGWRPWGGGGGETVGEKDGGQQRYISRPAGINQPGAIPGFSEYLAASQRRMPPSKTKPDTIDRDALRDGLGE